MAISPTGTNLNIPPRPVERPQVEPEQNDIATVNTNNTENTNQASAPTPPSGAANPENQDNPENNQQERQGESTPQEKVGSQLDITV